MAANGENVTFKFIVSTGIVVLFSLIAVIYNALGAAIDDAHEKAERVPVLEERLSSIRESVDRIDRKLDAVMDRLQIPN